MRFPFSLDFLKKIAQQRLVDMIPTKTRIIMATISSLNVSKKTVFQRLACRKKSEN